MVFLTVGDIFNDMRLALTTTPVVIQPAASVSILITSVSSENNSVRMSGENATGAGVVMKFSQPSASSTQEVATFGGNVNMKLFITNSDYIEFYMSAGTAHVQYSGIQVQ